MLASRSGKNVMSTVSSTLDSSPKPSHTRNSGATAIFGTSCISMSGGDTTRRAPRGNAMTNPRGKAGAGGGAEPHRNSGEGEGGGGHKHGGAGARGGETPPRPGD